jgi:hypothetical protein
MKALEQVRLPGSVRPHRQHETAAERELEQRVRPVVPERQLADDQPASLIGMIR